jgi:hypothetical protein
MNSEHGKNGEEHVDTRVYTGSVLWRVKPYVQFGGAIM